MSTSNIQLNAFRKNLLRLEPPNEVLQKFDELCRIQSEIQSDDALEDLLFDSCRVSNWAVPWESGEEQLTFRAKLLEETHPDYKQDVGGANSPSEEQCYRRGYDQGFAHAFGSLSHIPSAQDHLRTIGERIHVWRVARLHSRERILWGDIVEPIYSCVVRTTARRSNLPLKKRFEVLERDQRRCVCCGVTAAMGAVLEIDHIVPVAKGGSDDLENLQVLCFDCNRGKSDSFFTV